jgi:hypothetical protein
MNRKMIVAGASVFGLALVLSLLGLCAEIARATSAAATVRYVAPGTSCGENAPCYGSLQAAVNAADDGDVIRVAEGVYTDTQVDPDSSTPTLVYITKTVTLEGGWSDDFTAHNPSMYLTILDGQRRGPVIYVSGVAAAPTIDGFVITGGDGASMDAICGYEWVAGCGGGISVRQAAPVIANNVITNNIGSSGGIGYGGGIHIVNGGAGTRITNNTIISNTASPEGGVGGGISLLFCYNTIPISGNHIEQNNAMWGGGIGSYYSVPFLARNLIADNASAYDGAAVYFTGGSPTLDSNRILSNTADSGAAVRFWVVPSFTMANNVIAENTTSDPGSAVEIRGNAYITTSGTLLHNTIAHNGGASGTGIVIAEYVNATISNTMIVSHTTAGITVTTSASATVTAGYNVFWDNGSDPFTGSNPVMGNPLLSADYHITSGPAIDAGMDVGVTSDMDGELRPYQAPDIGADEYWPPGTLKRVFLPLVAK